MTEAYQPTAQEKQNIKVSPSTLKLSGDQVFFTLQGEGKSIGKPAVFLRLHMCNLSCSWCDTKYTWDKSSREYWQESQNWSYGPVLKEVKKYGSKRLVITGGEPLLQQGAITEFISLIPEWDIEIETNGTIAPNRQLAERCQFNVSPKLSNAGDSKTLRYKPDVLQAFNKLPNSTFKFVIQEPSDLEEVQTICDEIGLDSTKIVIMPEGITQPDIAKHALAIADEVKEKGWRLLPRLQVMIWGDKRGT